MILLYTFLFTYLKSQEQLPFLRERSISNILLFDSVQENMVFLTQNVVTHDTYVRYTFVVSSIMMYNMWCLL